MKELDVVCGVIQQGNRYLIARRGKGVHENIWEFPGGKVELKETHEEAVYRELKEELGCECVVDQYLMSLIDQRSDVRLHIHAYLCHILKGKPVRRVHHELRYVYAKQLEEFPFEEADAPLISRVMSLSTTQELQKREEE